jgi:hypothetical protein
MSLSKRLGWAAQLRTTSSSPPDGVGLDVTGPTAAVDLRGVDRAPASTRPTPTPERGASASRVTLRRQRLERRDATLAQQRAARFADAPHCPRCGARSRIDINDRTRGVLYVSCDSCFNMWQEASKPSASLPYTT